MRAAVLMVLAVPVGSYCAQRDAVSPVLETATSFDARALARADDGGKSGIRLLRSPLPAGTRVHVLSRRKLASWQATLVRLACDDQHACLPFYAVVGEDTLPVDGLGLVPFDLPREPHPGSVQMPVRTHHAGDRVEIVEEFSGLKLRAKGVCLQSGSMGDRIRVRTLLNHHVLVAKVAGAGEVQVEP
jgi:Chaperone for flagella basal body P-ring formation